jgi:hypothetical protein
VNKTIAPSTIAKSVTSKTALAAAKKTAVDGVLAELAKVPRSKASKESTPRPRRGKEASVAVSEGEEPPFAPVVMPSSAERLSAAQLLNESTVVTDTPGSSMIPVLNEVEVIA